MERAEPPHRAQHRTRDDGVTETACDELERCLHVLHLDHRSQRDARSLGLFHELSARRIRSAEGGIVKNERHLGELLDRHRRAVHPLGVAADDDELLAVHGSHIEAVVVHGRRDERRLEPPFAHGVGDERRVLAHEPQPHVGVAAPEVRGEVGDQVRGCGAEHAEAERSAGQLSNVSHRVPRTREIGDDALHPA